MQPLLLGLACLPGLACGPRTEEKERARRKKLLRSSFFFSLCKALLSAREGMLPTPPDALAGDCLCLAVLEMVFEDYGECREIFGGVGILFDENFEFLGEEMKRVVPFSMEIGELKAFFSSRLILSYFSRH